MSSKLAKTKIALSTLLEKKKKVIRSFDIFWESNTQYLN